MYFESYQDLEDHIVDWMDRQDIRDKVQQFARFVTTKAAKVLRTQAMERTMIVPVLGNGSAKIPFDLVETVAINWLSYSNGEGTFKIKGRTPLQRGSIHQLDEYRSGNVQETNPNHFTDIGRYFYLYPVAITEDGVVNSTAVSSDVVGYCEVVYYALPTSFSDNLDTNWILQTSPELYFYGCMMMACEFVRDFDRATYWESKYNKAMDIIQAWSDKAEEAGGPIVIEGSDYVK